MAELVGALGLIGLEPVTASCGIETVVLRLAQLRDALERSSGVPVQYIALHDVPRFLLDEFGPVPVGATQWWSEEVLLGSRMLSSEQAEVWRRELSLHVYRSTSSGEIVLAREEVGRRASVSSSWDGGWVRDLQKHGALKRRVMLEAVVTGLEPRVLETARVLLGDGTDIFSAVTSAEALEREHSH